MKFSALWTLKSKLYVGDRKATAKFVHSAGGLTLLFIDGQEGATRWHWDAFEPEHICHVAPDMDVGRRMAQDLMPDYVLCDVYLPGDAAGTESTVSWLGVPPTPNHVPLLLLLTAWDESRGIADLGATVSVNTRVPRDERQFLLCVCEMFFNRTTDRHGPHRRILSPELREAVTDGLEPLTLSTADRQFLTSVHGAILDALGKSSVRKPAITLPMIARACGRSTRVVQRKLTALTGLSFGEYKSKLRMREARKLLHGTANITEIALALGYTSPAHFSAAFRMVHGMSPRAWRHRLEKDDLPEINPSANTTLESVDR